jgi:thiol-disulfide isomerase/thioredoxin
MKIIYALIFLIWASFFDGYAQVQVISAGRLDRIMNTDDDTTRVINFWATWCSPCIEELPYFEAVNETMADKKIKVLLVSLDFRSVLESSVVPFLKKKNIRSEALLLDEPDANSYIDQISPEWSGAIPATLIVNNRKHIRRFYEKKFTKNELFSILETITERNIK